MAHLTKLRLKSFPNKLRYLAYTVFLAPILVFAIAIVWGVILALTVPMGEVGGLGDATLYEYMRAQYPRIRNHATLGEVPEHCFSTRLFAPLLAVPFSLLYWNKLHNPDGSLAAFTPTDYQTYLPDASIYEENAWSSQREVFWKIYQYTVFAALTNQPGDACYAPA